MDRAVRNVTQFSSWTLRDAVRAATLNPATAVGMAASHGILKPEVPADFAVLSPNGVVRKTIIAGRGF
jgi:N-acetylglucosamine-6-phosphate deacetylase